MEELIKAAKELASQLSESDCCRAYATAREEVEQDAELKQRLAAYKACHLSCRTKFGNTPVSDEERVVGELYWALMLDDRARNFLESEREAADLVAMLFRTIAEGCPVEPAYPQQ